MTADRRSPRAAAKPCPGLRQQPVGRTSEIWAKSSPMSTGTGQKMGTMITTDSKGHSEHQIRSARQSGCEKSTPGLFQRWGSDMRFAGSVELGRRRFCDLSTGTPRISPFGILTIIQGNQWRGQDLLCHASVAAFSHQPKSTMPGNWKLALNRSYRV